MGRKSKSRVNLIVLFVSLILITTLVGYGLYNKFYNGYTNISDIRLNESYTFKMEFDQFGFVSTGEFVTPPYWATVMIFKDSSGTAMIGEIDGTLWYQIEHLGFMLEHEELLEGTWIFDAEVVDTTVADIYENVETMQITDVDIIIKVHSFHKIKWYE